MGNSKYDIGLEGRPWGDDAQARHDELPQKIEMIRGRLFWSDEDRITVLAALMQHVGAAAAVRIGDPEVWKAAVRGLD